MYKRKQNGLSYQKVHDDDGNHAEKDKKDDGGDVSVGHLLLPVKDAAKL